MGNCHAFKADLQTAVAIVVSGFDNPENINSS
jgi:hypothetical protein